MNLNELREICAVEIFPGNEDLFSRLSEVIFEFDMSTPEATKMHGDCDCRLFEKLESALEPLVGKSGIDGERWFHSMDYYGDGVRLVEAEWATLSIPLVMEIKSLLYGEHEQFCVLWKVFEDFQGEHNGERGALVVFRDRILITETVLSQKKLNA